MEDVSERYTMQELSRKHDLHPNQISTWKKEFLQNGADVFGEDTVSDEKKRMWTSFTKCSAGRK